MLESKSDQWPIFLNQPACALVNSDDGTPVISEELATERNVRKENKRRRKPAPPDDAQSSSLSNGAAVSEALIETRYDQYSAVPVVPFGEVKGEVSVQPLLPQPSRDADQIEKQGSRFEQSKGSFRLLIVTSPLLGAIALSGVLVLAYKPGAGNLARSIHADQSPLESRTSESTPRGKLIYDRFPSDAGVASEALFAGQAERTALAAAGGPALAQQEKPVPRETVVAVTISEPTHSGRGRAARPASSEPRRVRTVVVRADGTIVRSLEDGPSPDTSDAPVTAADSGADAAPEVVAHALVRVPPPSQPAPLPEAQDEVAPTAPEAPAIPAQQAAEPKPAEGESVAMPLPLRKPARVRRPARVERVRVVSRPQEQAPPDEAEWRSDAFGESN